MIDLHKEENGIKGKRVFIAGPFTAPDPRENTYIAIRAGIECIQNGHFPFIPHLFYFANEVERLPEWVWMFQDRQWLEMCEALIRLPGPSAGADGEVQAAKQLDIPIYYSVEDFLRAG